MSDYEKLRYLIGSSTKMVRYKTPHNGWRALPFLSIHEDCAQWHKKPSGMFVVRSCSLPYDNDRKKFFPYIDIFTFDPKQPDKKANHDTLFPILTHEYGHFVSWNEKMRPSDYEEARGIFSLGKKFYHRMTDRDKLLVIEEEERAWNEGIKFVKSKGFKLTPKFYRRKRLALATYYRALK
jgi:hypothetical protein